MPNNFVKLNLSSDAEDRLKRHLKMRIMALEEGLTQLHEDKITKWRKAYEAVPREATRDFPFTNASNLIVPIIAIFSDTLLARVMSAVLKTRPTWIAKIFGSHSDIDDRHRTAVEDLLEYAGIEPEELDLYRVYHEWFSDAIKYGTSMIKAPHETRYRDEMLEMVGDGSGTKPRFIRELEYDGPRPEKIPFENFMIPPGAKALKYADIKIHKRPMTRSELEERRFFQVYDPLRVDSILDKPDRTGPTYTQSMKEDGLGARTTGDYGYAEWDLYECWLKWPTPDGNFRPRIIATYHKQSDTLLRAIYDTHKIDPWVLARLFYRDDSCYGYGFCETMWSFQEEISESHNKRLDNRTIANTRVWRVDPDSKLHAGYRIYPSATVPAEKDEIEPMPCGDISPQTIEDEQFALELAERRAGISPPMQGAGTGSAGKKGIYSSMGTLSVMQEGNRRTDLNISDLRYASTQVGRVILSDYSENGVPKSIMNVFGDRDEVIKEAIKAVKDGKIGLPIYSSTSSVNREVEKQNDLILVNVMRQHYMGIAQLIAQVNSPMTPPQVKPYLQQVIKASNVVMKSILRSFDKEDVDQLVPDPEDEEQSNGEGQSAQQAPGASAPNPNVIGFPGGPATSGLPPGMPTGGVGQVDEGR